MKIDFLDLNIKEQFKVIYMTKGWYNFDKNIR